MAGSQENKKKQLLQELLGQSLPITDREERGVAYWVVEPGEKAAGKIDIYYQLLNTVIDNMHNGREDEEWKEPPVQKRADPAALYFPADVISQYLGNHFKEILQQEIQNFQRQKELSKFRETLEAMFSRAATGEAEAPRRVRLEEVPGHVSHWAVDITPMIAGKREMVEAGIWEKFANDAEWISERILMTAHRQCHDVINRLIPRSCQMHLPHKEHRIEERSEAESAKVGIFYLSKEDFLDHKAKLPQLEEEIRKICHQKVKIDTGTYRKKRTSEKPETTAAEESGGLEKARKIPKAKKQEKE